MSVHIKCHCFPQCVVNFALSSRSLYDSSGKIIARVSLFQTVPSLLQDNQVEKNRISFGKFNIHFNVLKFICVKEI